MKTVTIHQVQNLCWLGTLDKFSKSDEFVLLDTVDFEKNYFQNRTKIRTSQGWQYLTIPVESHNHKPLKEILVCNDINWKKKYLNTIKQNYSRTPFFDKYYPFLERIINKNYTHLIDYNRDFLYSFLEWLEINKPFYYSSQLGLNPALKSTNLLIEICKKLNATTYLSGLSGKDYLNLEKFKEKNIDVKFHNFFHPVYKQLYEPFLPGMSSFDLLMNYDDQSKKIIKAKGIGAIELIFKKIDYKNKKILEMFGGKGDGHLSYYANNNPNVTIWELNEDNFNQLQINYPLATKVNKDSLQELHNNYWHNYFDILIIDAPANLNINQCLPKSLCLLKKEGIVIFRNIINPYLKQIETKPDLSLKEWNEIIRYSGYDIIKSYEQPREYFYEELWLSNFVFNLKRRNE